MRDAQSALKGFWESTLSRTQVFYWHKDFSKVVNRSETCLMRVVQLPLLLAMTSKKLKQNSAEQSPCWHQRDSRLEKDLNIYYGSPKHMLFKVWVWSVSMPESYQKTGIFCKKRRRVEVAKKKLGKFVEDLILMTWREFMNVETVQQSSE